MSYLVSGNNPAAIKTAERNIFTATAGQTTFTITQGYQPGDIDVFLNGVRLIDSDDYTATNGSTVVLTSGSAVGDSLAVVCYRPYQVTDFYTKSEQDTRYVNVAGDTMSGSLGIGVAPSAPLTIGRVSSTNEGGQIDLCRSSDNASTWGIDVYGDTSTPSLRILDNIAAAVRLQIDGSGIVTKPYQPWFSAYRNTATNYSDGQTVIWNATIAGSNVTNSYSTSTGRFTAPAAGVYLFRADFRQAGNGVGYFDIRSSTGLVTRHEENASYPNGYHQTLSCMYKLNVGDYVWTQAGGSTVISPDPNTIDRFEGYLLG